MAIDLTILAALLGVGVSFAALLSPVLKLHSRLDLLHYQVQELQRQQREMSQRLYCVIDKGEENR